MQQINKKDWSLIFLGSILLMFWAFHNKFPLVYSDTGTYIRSGFENYVPDDRPFFYGWFIRHSSFHRTLWLTIWFQAFIGSYLSFRVLSVFSSENFRKLKFLFIITLLVLASPFSQKVSTLMPDIFSAYLLLSFLVIFFAKKIGRIELSILLIIFLFSALCHYSNMFTLLLFLFTLGIFIYFKRSQLSKEINVKAFYVLSGVLFLAYLCMPVTNYLVSKEFYYSKSNHVFLMNNFVVNGYAQKYLKEKCADNNNKYKMCYYKDSLDQIDFLWDYKNSPLYRTGGWEKNKQEFDAIIYDMLTTPKYLAIFIYKSAQNSLDQFFSNEILIFADNPSYGADSSPFYALNLHIKDEINNYLNSYQRGGKLNYDDLNRRFTLLIFFAFIFMIILWLSPFLKGLFSMRIILALNSIVLFLAINATVCASFSCALARYQNRLSWILPFVIIIILSDLPIVNRQLLKIKEAIQRN